MYSITRYRDLINSNFATIARTCADEAQQLALAAGYVAESGGKRLRGLLTAAIACDLGFTSEDDLIRLAVALEAVHTASLVHDDLPALDNDDVRRGRPSCHKVFGEATAILTGDYLFGLAFKTLMDSCIADHQKTALARSLSDTWISLCVGQQLDLGVGGDANRSRMFELKTGALFACAATWGSIAAGLGADASRQYYDWGNRLGVLFQKLDDQADGDGEIISKEVIATESEQVRSALRCLMGQAGHHTFEVVSLIVQADL